MRWSLAFVLLTLTVPAAVADDGVEGEVPFDERSGNVFFQEPDGDTEREIDELIDRFSTGAMLQRRRWRRQLQSIGYWSVAPLIEALEAAGTPKRSAAALTLMGMDDPRATDHLRAAVVRETSNPYVAAFAALALGRRRDADAVPAFATALRSSKGQSIFRAAVPLALARIRSPEAEQLLVKRLGSSQGDALVRASRVLALGFFPRSALAADSPAPGGKLAQALRSNRREHRRAATVAYLVATVDRDDTRDTLLGILKRADFPEAVVPALIGLSRYEDAATTRKLADVAAHAKDDMVRHAAADLLIDRGDVAALEDLLGLARRASDTRVRAAAVLALGSIGHADARAVIVDRIDDRARLVRGAAAVAAARHADAATRDAALRRIEARLRRGEPDRDVRANLETARDVLNAQRREPRWVEVGAEPLFWQLDMDYPARLLHAVNHTTEYVLDLHKIRNLLSDAEVDSASLDGTGGGSDGGGGGEGSEGGEGGEGDGGGDGGDDGGAEGDGGGEGGGVGGGGFEPAGKRLYHTWAELRDLKAELRDFPYFGSSDLAR